MSNIDKDTLAVHTFITGVQKCILDIVENVNSMATDLYSPSISMLKRGSDYRGIKGDNIFTSSNIVDKFTSLLDTVEETDPDLYYGKMHMNITVLLDICYQLADMIAEHISRYASIEEKLFTFIPTKVDVNLLQVEKLNGEIFPIHLGKINVNSDLIPGDIVISYFINDDFHIYLEQMRYGAIVS